MSELTAEREAAEALRAQLDEMEARCASSSTEAESARTEVDALRAKLQQATAQHEKQKRSVERRAEKQTEAALASARGHEQRAATLAAKVAELEATITPESSARRSRLV